MYVYFGILISTQNMYILVKKATLFIIYIFSIYYMEERLAAHTAKYIYFKIYACYT